MCAVCHTYIMQSAKLIHKLSYFALLDLYNYK